MFATDIYNILSEMYTDIFPGGIYTHNLPDNWEMGEPTLVIQYRAGSRVKTLDRTHDQTDYELILALLSQSTEINEDMAAEMITRLDAFDSLGHIFNQNNKIADISYSDDLNSFDEESGLYVKIMNFTCIYNNN
jgi:hypothetical protein